MDGTFDTVDSAHWNFWGNLQQYQAPIEATQKVEVKISNWSNPKSCSQNLQMKQSKKFQPKSTKNQICHHCKLIKNMCSIISPKHSSAISS